MKALLKNLQLGSSISVLLLIGLLIVLFPSRKKKSSLTGTNPQAAQLDRLIQSELINSGIEPGTAKMWAAVARHESNVYRSELFINANNFFGMTKPKSRETFALPGAVYTIGNMRYAVFRSPSDSVHDLALYMRNFSYPSRFSSVHALVAFMKSKGYFGDTLENYQRGVEFHFKRVAL